MDKNFIKVDDLFRQRLTGGEEKERGGAWLNMRDLLDKEMPQEKRIGILYWRRLFGVVAALSLVGTVSVGSYELSSAFKSRNMVDVSVPPISANNEAGNAYELSATEKVKADEARAAARTNGRIADKITNGKARHTVVNTTMQNGATISGNTGDAADNTTHTITAGNAVANNTSDNSSNEINTSVNRNNTSLHSVNNTNTAEATGAKEIAIRNHRSINNNRHIAAGQAGNVAANEANETNNGQKAARNSGDNSASASAIAGRNGTDRHATAANSGSNATGKTANVVSGNNAGTTQNSNGVNTDIKNKAVLSSSSSNNAVAANTASGNKASNNTNVPEATAHKAHVAAAHKETVKEAGANNQAVATGTSVAATTTAKNGVAVADNNDNTPDNAGVASTVTAPAAGVALKNANTENVNGQNKKVITKLLVHQRNIKVAENEYALKEDTISMEKINMDMGLKQPGDNNATPADLSATVKAKKGARRLFGSRNRNNAVANTATANIGGAGATAPATTGGKAGRNSQSNSGNVAANAANEYAANGSATGSTDGAIMAKPGSVATSGTASEGMSSETAVIKPKATTKQGSGASLIQRLSMAFNDVKENAAKTRFTPGLTAGINSNFFGPATFKGFQFGLTGDIIFNENWNVLTELKYFHRLNNNTSIEDDYYTYTQVGSEYRKDLQLNSYSFSALHSLEMPVSIRYHKGAFNFYAGGNFLYQFSINTGASTMPATNVAPEFVSAPGNDNTPKLSEADFHSRFGLGYLFGFSYDVAPNLSMDLRNVQTVWDNAATTGAKSISGQLYKTPSLQLSIMYRLGGNRNKD